MGRKGRRTKEMVEVAKERMAILFERAELEVVRGGECGQARVNRYIGLARRIGSRYNVRMPGPRRRSFCRRCNGRFLPSSGGRVRVRRGRVIQTCGRCGNVWRYNIGKERPTEGD